MELVKAAFLYWTRRGQIGKLRAYKTQSVIIDDATCSPQDALRRSNAYEVTLEKTDHKNNISGSVHSNPCICNAYNGTEVFFQSEPQSRSDRDCVEIPDVCVHSSSHVSLYAYRPGRRVVPEMVSIFFGLFEFFCLGPSAFVFVHYSQATLQKKRKARRWLNPLLLENLQ